MGRTVGTHGRAECVAELAGQNQLSSVDAQALVEALQRSAFAYFMYETNPANGLVADKAPASEPPWAEGAPASITAVGFALGAYPVAVERHPQPARIRGLRALLLGAHSQRRPWLGDAPNPGG